MTPENDSLLAYLQRRLDEAANATPEEIEEANPEWEDFQRSLQENLLALRGYSAEETETL